jgi:transposase
MFSRHLVVQLNGNEIKKVKPADADRLFKDPFAVLAAKNKISTVVVFLESRAKQIEKAILAAVKLEKQFEVITSMPGVGNILGLTVMLEAGLSESIQSVPVS